MELLKMNTKTAMTEYRLTSWAEMIHERDCSGLTVSAYCESIGLAKHIYYYRLKKVREAACKRLPEAQVSKNALESEVFTKVEVSESAPSSMSISRNQVCFEVSDLRLTAGSDYPIEKLKELLHVVSSL